MKSRYSTAAPEKRRALIELGAHEAANVADACRRLRWSSRCWQTMTAASAIALAEDGMVAQPRRGRDPSFDEYDQCRALEAPGAGARASRTALRRRAGVRAPGYGGRGQAVHRRGGRSRERSMPVHPLFQRDGTEDHPDRHGAVGGESRQAQRQLSCGGRHRGSGRGRRAHRQGRHRPRAPTSSSSPPRCSTRRAVQDLRPADRRGQV